MLHNNQYYLESVCNTCLLIWESTGILLTYIRSLENFCLVEVKLVSSFGEFLWKFVGTCIAVFASSHFD